MSPTLAMRPMHHPPAFETIPELAPVLEYQHYTNSGGGANTTSNCNSSVSFSASASSLHSRNTVRKHSSAVPTTVAARSQLPPLDTALPLAYPMYPGLQTASNTTTTTITGMSNNTTTAITAAGSTAPPTTTIMSRRGQEPRSLNRPRKISTSYSRRDSSSSSPRCPSYETSQQYRIQYQSPTSSSPPLSILPRPPQQQQQNKKKPPPSEQPNALFGTLPGEVLQVVLEWLQSVHLDSSTSTSCATCWARDLCSLCLASRKWSEVARLALYQDIRIVGDDSAAHRKRFKLAQGCRMTLLRRTLRANSRLAAAVRSLQLPMPVGDSCDATPSSSSSSRVAAGGLSPKQVYENRVASLVMACPNLEVLVGPGATHDHDTFNRITHALSTRTNLKTMNWRIGASSGSGSDLIARPASASHRESSSVFSSTLACMLPPPPPPLNAAQETSFLGHHRQWHSLASLSVHCLPGASLAPDTLLQRALTCLPSLQHLHLSRVPGNAFGDAALLSLPALRSLTLAHLPGVTAGGLSGTRRSRRCPRSRGSSPTCPASSPLRSCKSLRRSCPPPTTTATPLRCG
ncbi:hypothetical protein BBAD15_g5164 [Beauveria bassiana D1-5]|uniref:F-box domain-containing protein n=1 Tax=Beauveria bassiana D1-5 TaxID=1245745 RepID=A0A0A2VTF9_BEABA|nr:hypothetical protein BBAD15_g5164 [Beauveria bassiana D1-5]